MPILAHQGPEPSIGWMIFWVVFVIGMALAIPSWWTKRGALEKYQRAAFGSATNRAFLAIALFLTTMFGAVATDYGYERGVLSYTTSHLLLSVLNPLTFVFIAFAVSIAVFSRPRFMIPPRLRPMKDERRHTGNEGVQQCEKISVRKTKSRTSGSVQLIFHRPRAMQDLLRTYRLLVDGVSRGKIRFGGAVQVEVPPGVHRVQARISWTGSPPVEFEASGGDEVHFVVGPAVEPDLSGSTGWLRLTKLP